jgi:DNA polymerase III delta subunit
LRKIVEARENNALAIPCYADDARGVQALIDEELAAAAGLTIQGEARQRLSQLLGGDRLASRGELRKLALYCHGSGTVTDADVVEAIGDVAALSVDDAIEAVFSGDAARLEAALERILASKTSVYLVLRGCLVQLEQLDAMRALVESQSRQPAQVMAEKGRGIHFKRKPIVERALRHWTLKAINARDAIVSLKQFWKPESGHSSKHRLHRQALAAHLSVKSDGRSLSVLNIPTDYRPIAGKVHPAVQASCSQSVTDLPAPYGQAEP